MWGEAMRPIPLWLLLLSLSVHFIPLTVGRSWGKGTSGCSIFRERGMVNFGKKNMRCILRLRGGFSPTDYGDSAMETGDSPIKDRVLMEGRDLLGGEEDGVILSGRGQYLPDLPQSPSDGKEFYSPQRWSPGRPVTISSVSSTSASVEPDEANARMHKAALDAGLPSSPMDSSTSKGIKRQHSKEILLGLSSIDDEEEDDSVISPEWHPDLLKEARFLLNNRKYSNASEVLLELCERFPRTWEVRLHTGAALYECRRYREAAVMFKVASQLGPYPLKAHLYAGNSLLALGRSQEAHEQYDKVINHGETLPGTDVLGMLKMVKLAIFGQAQAKKYDAAVSRAAHILEQVKVRVSLAAPNAGCRGKEAMTDEAKRVGEACCETVQQLAADAQSVATASMAPTTLQVQGLLIAGKYREAEVLCERSLVDLDAFFVVGDQSKEAKLYTAPEVWLLHARAVHLQGHMGRSLKILERGRAEKLKNLEWLLDDLYSRAHVPDDLMDDARVGSRTSAADREIMMHEANAEREQLQLLMRMMDKAVGAAKVFQNMPTNRPSMERKRAVEEVLGLFKEAIDRAPWHDAFVARLLAERSRVYLDANKYLESIQDATDSLKRLGSNLIPLALRGSARRKLCLYSEAYEDFNAAYILVKELGNKHWSEDQWPGGDKNMSWEIEMDKCRNECKKLMASAKARQSTGAEEIKANGPNVFKNMHMPFWHDQANEFNFNFGGFGGSRDSSGSQQKTKQKGRSSNGGTGRTSCGAGSSRGAGASFPRGDVNNGVTSEILEACERLGVNLTATYEEAKKAYYAKSKLTHPDKNLNDPKATENFQALGKSWDAYRDHCMRINNQL